VSDPACVAADVLIGDHLSGVLVADDQATLHDHLAACAACRARLAALLRTQRALDESGAEAGMTQRRQRLHAALVSGAPPTAIVARVGRRPNLRWSRHLVALAALLALAVGAAAWGWQPGRRAPQVIGSVVAAGGGVIERAGTRFDLIVGSQCHAGDRLEVPAGATPARCVLWAGSGVELSPGTTLTIAADIAPTLDLVHGTITVDSGALSAAGRHLRVHSRAGTVVTEGTRFRLRVDGERASVAVEAGAVRIANTGGQARVVAWQRLNFSSAAAPAAPVATAQVRPFTSLAVGGRVVHVTIAPDDATIATGNSNGQVALWDAASGARRRDHLTAPPAVKSLAFAADGRRLAIETTTGTVQLWDLDSGGGLTVPLRTAQITCAAFAPGGGMLALGHSGGRITLIEDVQRPLPAERSALEGHTAVVQALAFSADGRRLLSGAADGSVRLWDADGHRLAAFADQAGAVGAVAFAPDGERMAAGFGPRLDSVWALTTPAPAPSPRLRAVAAVFSAGERIDLVGPEHGIYALAFTPDGRLLISGSGDGVVTVWDAASGKRLHTVPAHSAPVRAVAIAADGTLLASAGNDGVVRLWRLLAETE